MLSKLINKVKYKNISVKIPNTDENIICSQSLFLNSFFKIIIWAIMNKRYSPKVIDPTLIPVVKFKTQGIDVTGDTPNCDLIDKAIPNATIKSPLI